MSDAAAQFQSPFLRTFVERGYYNDCTDRAALDALLGKERVTAYIGFDCTASSLHVGNLVQIMTLRRLQQAGHKPIVLMGGGTTKVGDPSGKEESRQLLTREQIEANKQSILGSFMRFLSFDGSETGAIMADNAEWLDRLEYISFLRDVGRHFSVNRMLTMDSVRLRLEREQPLTFLEFNYMILQSYDFLELHRRYGCRLQCGGSDQWGNIVSGIDLVRRIDNVQVFGLTSSLITTASGAKMGKTAQGAVWLNADMCSPYQYWQYWRNTEDADVGRFLRLFTDLPPAEIERLEQLQGSELNDAKKVLATEATALCHGREAAEEAAATARRTFESGEIASGLPTVELPRAKLEQGVLVANLAHLAGLTSSSGEARRLIQSGGIRLNDESVADVKATAGLADLTPEGVLKISVGRKKHALIKPV
ncbi:MAG TPA: tyrosine--tRNA ligase [Rhizomicrobium sp.]|jgi:tyrosyl-tRNA synthetase|nr:tyrosine--tRNA ligase [Rhizomicrobium sp.]